ncbi:unnamed protein product [Notodromas monacha]|uniref:Small subunit processome component 20 homolog n=1 Tax=Notodromas monacha TaxID=399045 RepID=A0A7R9GEG8_9CRUS|nr:unnamed protein product [Notodromas monacha]CAG0918262.1 unnamed protein product [Notodromas monacha]
MKHREENTFRFRSFTDLLSSINVDVVHHIRRVDDEPEERVTYFHEKLADLQDLNSTESFLNFVEDVGRDFETLPQLIVTKDAVVGKLKEHLVKEDNIAVPALLELVSALARDLQFEFYPYFYDFFDIILNLCKLRDAERVQACFTCLATLFKFLWRYLIKDIVKFFKAFVQLLHSSEPPHVRTFAAQCFAFLFRKVPEQMSVLLLLLDELTKDGELAEGFGFLLSDAVRGVKGKFHSSFESTMRLVFDLFKSCSCVDSLEEVLRITFERMAGHASISDSRADVLRVWNLLKAFVSEETGLKETNPAGWCCALKCVRQWSCFHGGRLIVDLHITLDICASALNQAKVYEEEEIIVSALAQVLMNESRRSVALDLLTKGISSVFTSDVSKHSVCDFVNALCSHNFAYLDSHVLPRFLALIISSAASKNGASQCDTLHFLESLSKIRESKGSEFHFEHHVLRFLPANIERKSLNVKDVLTDWLLGNITLHLKEDVDKKCLMYMLSCVAHCHPVNVERVWESLQSLWTSLMKASLEDISETGSLEADEISSCLFLVARSLHSFDSDMFADLVTSEIEEGLMNSSLASDPRGLQILLYVMTTRKATKPDAFTIEALEKVYEKLKHNLMASETEARRLVLKIFALYPVELPNPEKKSLSVFELCLKAEEFPDSMEHYREKLIWLEKLDFDLVQSSLPVGLRYDLAPVYFIIGNMYTNLSLLWKPCAKVLCSHAVSLPGKEFWYEAMKPALETAAKLAADAVLSSVAYEEEGDENFQWFLQSLRKGGRKLSGSGINVHVDHVHWRNTIWRSMEDFIGVLEPFNRDLVELFLSFLETEYYRSNFSLLRQEDLTMANEMEEREKKPKSRTRTPAFRSLLAHLKVFAMFKAGTSIARKSDMKKAYYELLLSGRSEVQKAALDCIFAFGPKTCPAARENLKERLYRLQDGKTFKKEMMALNSDLNSGAIDEDVRERCRENEYTKFFELAFGSEMWSLGMSLPENEAEMSGCVLAPPLRKRKAGLLLIGTIFQQIGNRITGELRSHILRVMLVIGAQSVVLMKRNDLHSKVLERLKDVRNTVQKRLTHFFEVFDNYDWTERELDFIFEYLIAPQLPRLAEDTSNAASVLLKFLLSLGKNPRYYPLLCKKGATMTPIDAILDLVSIDKLDESIAKLLFQFFVDLTTLERGEADAMSLPIAEAANIPVWEKRELNFGTRLLIPHVSKILKAIEKVVIKESLGRMRNESDKNVLAVLTTLSEISDDAEQNEMIVGLLINHLVKSEKLDDEARLQLTISCANFSRNVENWDARLKFIRELSPLLGKRTGPTISKQLIEIFNALLGDKDGEWAIMKKFVSHGHAWNPKRAEEPNFKMRLDALSEINAILRSSVSLSMECLLMIVHTAFQFISWTDEMAIRDAGSNTMQMLVIFLFNNSATPGIMSDFLPNVVLKAVRRGILDTNENIRAEYHTILSVMVRESVKRNTGPRILKELGQLTNEDVEKDFFENMKHLKVFKRTKALADLAKGIRDDSYKFSDDTLGQVLLLLPSTYLFNRAYVKDNHLVDAAIEAQAAIASRLSWYRYKLLLNFCVKKILTDSEFHKVAVKTLTSVLNAFNFEVAASLPPGTETAAEVSPDDETKNEIELVDMDESTERTNAKVPIAAKIHNEIAHQFLPKLERLLSKRTAGRKQSENSKPVFQEDEDVLRVPIALALVKLLMKLPDSIRVLRLPGILLTVSTYLKSRAESVRASARSVLIKIMMILGCKYLPNLMRAMRSVLFRGYQVHVLVFTLHCVLKAMDSAKQISWGDLDESIADLTQVCRSELFEEISEEKEVAAITSKWIEARGGKAFDVFEILARYVSRGRVLDLFRPLQEVLSTAKSNKIVSKVSRCLDHLVLGLVQNEGLGHNDLILLSRGLVKESIPQLQLNAVAENTKKPKRDKRLRPDGEIFLIPAEPKRAAAAVKTALKVHSHLLVQAGLEVLLSSLKNKKICLNIEKDVDGFLMDLIALIDHQSVKLVTVALRCLALILRAAPEEIPSFKADASKTLKDKLFAIIHKYSSPGMCISENDELVTISFKLMTQMIWDIDSLELTESQLKLLLLHAEADLKDTTKQAMGFALLKAILKKKFAAEEIGEVMKGVARIAIVAESVQERFRARQAYLTYLMDYPLSDAEISKAVDFFIDQMEYEFASGRDSAVEMLFVVVKNFPEARVDKFSPKLFVNLATRLVNETEIHVRQMVVMLLTKLLGRIGKGRRDALWDLTTLWLKNKAVSFKRLAAEVFSIFLNVEKVSFKPRLREALKMLLEAVKPSLYSDVPVSESAEDIAIAENHGLTVKLNDLFIVHVFRFILDLLSVNINALYVNRKMSSILRAFLDIAQRLLWHPQVQVKLVCAQIFGIVFQNLGDPKFVLAANGWHRPGFENLEIPSAFRFKFYLEFFSAPGWKKRVVNLLFMCFTQLQAKLLNEELATQVVKNLIYLSKFAVILNAPDHIQFGTEPKKSTEDDSAEKDEIKPIPSSSATVSDVCEENIELISIDDSDEDELTSNPMDLDLPEPFPVDEEDICDSDVRDPKDEPNEDDDVGNVPLKNDPEDLDRYLTFDWLSSKLKREAYIEMKKTPQVLTRRQTLFRWIAGLSFAVKSDLGTQALKEILPVLLPPLVRELSDPSCPPQLKALCEETGRYMKKFVGGEFYSNEYQKAQSTLNTAKQDRKRDRATLAVTNYEVSVKKKMRMNAAKGVSRKRKNENARIQRQFGGKKLKDLVKNAIRKSDEHMSRSAEFDMALLPLETHSYCRRWYLVNLYGAASFWQAAIFNSYGPIYSSLKAAYPGVWNDAQIAMQGNWGAITYVLFFIPTSFIMRKFGVRTVILGGVGLTWLGTGFRCLGVNPEPFLGLCHLCSVLNGIAGPLQLVVIPAYSARWFPNHQRTTATSIVVAWNTLGIAGSFLLPNLLVPGSDVDQDGQKLFIQQFMLIEFIVSSVLLLAILLYFPEKPLLPPSVTSSTVRPSSADSLRKFTTSPLAWALSLSFGLSLGATGIFSAVVNVDLQSLGIDEWSVNWFGGVTVISMCSLMLLVASVCDQFVTWLKTVTLTLLAVSSLFYSWFLGIYTGLIPASTATMFLSLGVAWATNSCILPLFLELTAEALYPVEESVSAGFLTGIQNIVGVFFLSLAFIPGINFALMINVAMVVCTILSFPVLAACKIEYKRSRRDERENED